MPTLADQLSQCTPPGTGAVIHALCATAAGIAVRLAGTDSPSASDANAAFAAAMKSCGVRFLASLTGNEVTEISLNGTLAVAIDPLGPSVAIETNTPPGTIFSIYQNTAGKDGDSFLRPGTEQIAAGCILYGPRTTLALTTGEGTTLFTLDREAGEFCIDRANLSIPSGATEFAANAADYRLWDFPVQRYIDDCLSGAEGPREQNFDMRWTGSLAAEVQRILARGGIYLAPRGPHALPSLIHHCHPVAMLIEQAGGRATDGRTRLLEKTAQSLQTPSALIFGLPEKVGRVAAYHDMPDNDVSPLFGRRGLFRT